MFHEPYEKLIHKNLILIKKLFKSKESSLTCFLTFSECSDTPQCSDNECASLIANKGVAIYLKHNYTKIPLNINIKAIAVLHLISI